MEKIENISCPKCGGSTTLRFVQSTGMDIQPTGLFMDCISCGFSQRIKSLDEKDNRMNVGRIEELEK